MPSLSALTTLRETTTRLRGTTARLRDATDGHVGVLFGLAVMPLLIAAGAALDYSRAADLSSRLQAGADGTILMLCQQPATVSQADLKAKALASLQSYVGSSGTVAIDDLQVSNAPRTVTLAASSSYPTAFMKLAGQPTVPVAAKSGCAAPETFYEIALVLDTTGSMASTSGSGQSKLDAAKTAAKNFVNYMYSTGALPGHIRMSLVPFAASVAIPSAYRTASWLDTSGQSPLHWQYVSNPSGSSFSSRLSIFNALSTTSSSWAWGGCVESPLYPFNVNDDAITQSKPGGLIMPLFAPDEEGNYYNVKYKGSTYTGVDTANFNSYIDDGSGTSSSDSACRSDNSNDQTRFGQACKYKARNNPISGAPGPNWSCTSRPLSTLGTAQSTLVSEIDALSAGGSTNVHEGFMWGWRTISPTNAFSNQSTPPVAYGTSKYQKIIVLMTDGTNQWLSDDEYKITTIGGSTYSAYGYFNNADGSSATSSNSRFVSSRKTLKTSSDGRKAIDELVAEACTNAKNKNVIVYTVGFSVSNDPIDQQGQTLLQNCASGTDKYFVASDGNAIVDVFAKIAKGIGSLRITR